jgi:hypothetical protein
MSNADEVAVALNSALEALADRTVESFERDGIDQAETEFRPGLRMQYAGMLDDLEIQIPQDRWEGGLDGEDVEAIVDSTRPSSHRCSSGPQRAPSRAT